MFRKGVTTCNISNVVKAANQPCHAHNSKPTHSMDPRLIAPDLFEGGIYDLASVLHESTNVRPSVKPDKATIIINIVKIQTIIIITITIILMSPTRHLPKPLYTLSLQNGIPKPFFKHGLGVYAGSEALGQSLPQSP